MAYQIRCFLALALAVALYGCDAAGPQANATDTPPQVLKYQTEDGRAVDIVVSDDYAGPGTAFATPDDYVQTLDGLRRTATTVTVRRSVWESLERSTDPFIVSLLDPSASVTVGDQVYHATPTAVYKTPVADPDSSPELELYYGVDGQEKIREINRLNSFATMPEELSRMTFHNPDIQAKAEQIVADGGDQPDAPNQGQRQGATSTSASARWGTERQYSPYYGVRLDNGAYWYVMVQGYNQDYGTWWQGYRAAGATQLLVWSYADGQWGAVGVGDRPYALGTQADLNLELMRTSTATNTLTCVSRRSENRELPFTNCNLLNTSGDRATGWDPKSKHFYKIYERSGDPSNPFSNRVVASMTLEIN